MNRKSRKKLTARVARAAQAEFEMERCVRPIDVLVGAGVICRERLDAWREGRIDDVDHVFRVRSKRLRKALSLFRSWAAGQGLAECETNPIPPGRRLQIGKRGGEAVARADCTHWAPSHGAAKQQETCKAEARASEIAAPGPKPGTPPAVRAQSRRKRAKNAGKRGRLRKSGAAVSRSKSARKSPRQTELEEFSWAEWEIEPEIQDYIEAAALERAWFEAVARGPDAGVLATAQDWAAWEKWTDTERCSEVEDWRPEDDWGALAWRGADTCRDYEEEYLRLAALPPERAFWNEPDDREEAEGWDDADAWSKADAEWEKPDERNNGGARTGADVPRIVGAPLACRAEAQRRRVGALQTTGDGGVGDPWERGNFTNALTLSEAEALSGPPGMIPIEWEAWASFEPVGPLTEFLDEEEWIDEFARAAPKRRRGWRRFRRRRKRKARRRNGGSGR